MFAIIIAPILGVWGIQFFLNKRWLAGIGFVVLSVSAYFLAYILKAAWPYTVAFLAALYSSISLYSSRAEVSIVKGVIQSSIPLKVYWAIMLFIDCCMSLIPFPELLEYY